MSTNAAANQRYFDSIADAYDTKPWFAATNKQVTDALRSRLDWIGIPFVNTGSRNDATEVRLLDYASGTGLMTRTLGPYVTVIRGIDVSPKMVSTYNTRMQDAGLSESTVYAVHGDLFNKDDPNPREFDSPEYKDFDIATVGFGFHHFEDVVHSARQLLLRLRPGGVLVINDFLEGGDMQADKDGNMIPGSEGNWAIHKHGGGHSHDKHDRGHHQSHEHEHKHDHAEKEDAFNSPEFKQKMNDSIVVPHFTIEGVKKFFTEAGFVDVDVVTLDERSYMEFAGVKVWRTILIARGRRPVEGKSEL